MYVFFVFFYYFHSFYANSVPCRPGESNHQPFNNKTLALSHSCPTSRMHSWIFIYFIRTFSQGDWSRSAFRSTSVEGKRVGRFQRYQSAKIKLPDRESDTGDPSHWPSGNPWEPVREFWINRTKSWSALGTSRTNVNGRLETVYNSYKQVPYLKELKKGYWSSCISLTETQRLLFHTGFWVFWGCWSTICGKPCWSRTGEVNDCSKSEHGSKPCVGLCEILCAAVSKLQVSGCMQWYQYRSLLMLQAQK